MTAKVGLLMLGTVLTILITGHWQIAICVTAGLFLALYVGHKVFVATERDNLPGFIESLFPDEVAEVHRRKKENALRGHHNSERGDQ